METLTSSNHFGGFLSPLFILPIMHDTRFTKTFRDYGLPSADEFPLSELTMKPEVLSEAKSRHAAYKQVANNLLGSSQRIEIETPLGSTSVNRKSLLHFVYDRKSTRERYVNFICPALEEPAEVWLWYDHKKGVYRQRFIKLFKTPDGKRSNFFAVAQENSDGSFLITAFPAKTSYINGQRTGVLLYGG